MKNFVKVFDLKTWVKLIDFSLSIGKDELSEKSFETILGCLKNYSPVTFFINLTVKLLKFSF